MPRRKTNAQIAMEFVILVGLLFFVMLLFLTFIREYLVDVRSDKDRELLKDIAYAVQAEIHIATGVDDGYERDFTVPEQIDHINYTINITGNQIWAATENSEVVIDIPEIVGTLSIGSNTIRKSGGVVYLNVGTADDTDAPVVTLVSPADESTDTDGDVVFTYQVVDTNSGIRNCSFIFDGSLNQSDDTISESVNQYFYLYNLAENTYNWTVNCTDNSPNNNSGQAAAWSFTIELVFNDPPTTPTSIVCSGSECNATFSSNVDINCSGSTDPENDTITYYIDAYYTTNLSINKSWNNIGTHSENGVVEWNISDYPDQNSVDIRCRAIDNGSGINSSYYDPSIDLEIANTGSQSGSTTNHDFNISEAGWTGVDWDLDDFEADPDETYLDSEGDPNGSISVEIPQGKYDEVGGFWRQGFNVTVNNPSNVTCSVGWKVDDYEATPITFQAYVFLDSTDGEPTIGEEVWSSGEQSGITTWADQTINCTSKVTSAGTYYYKLAVWVETDGGDNDGPYEILFDNAQVNWYE